MNKFNLETTLNFIEVNDLETDESFASVSLNPEFQWAKIVATDSLPNANKQGIPEDEFINLIKTGINSPVKMARGKISLGHDEAFGNPIGTIANLTKEGNKLVALAALWKRERPEDISLLKELYKKGNPPQVSWEISYAYSEVDENGIEWLRNTILNGLAIVGYPAYQGRTSFVAMSSKTEETMDEFEELKKQFSQLKEELENFKTEASQKEKSLTDALSEKEKIIEELNSQLEELKKYKEEVEAEKAKAEKLAKIKNKFVESGIEKPDEFFTEKAEMLLGMDENALEFMIQELVAFAELSKNSNAAVKVPQIKASKEDEIYVDPKELGKKLRENLSKSK